MDMSSLSDPNPYVIKEYLNGSRMPFANASYTWDITSLLVHEHISGTKRLFFCVMLRLNEQCNNGRHQCHQHCVVYQKTQFFFRIPAIEVIFHGYPTLPPTRKPMESFVFTFPKAMMHENAYVASISLSADVNQTVKARLRNTRKQTNKKRQFSGVFFYQSSQPVGFKVKPFCLKGLRFQKKSSEVSFWERVYFEYLVIFYCWMVRCLGATLWKRVHLDD